MNEIFADHPRRAGHDRPRRNRKADTKVLAGMLLSLGLCAGVQGDAVAADVGHASAFAGPAPWDAPLLSSLGDDPYVIDAGYNSGHFYRDDFAVDLANGNQSSPAKAVARMSDGSFVVAALVKNPAGNQSNGFWNLGLTHYSANGNHRLTWSNPNPDHAHHNNEYVVYPKTPSIHYRSIRDIKVVGGHIVVLIENAFSGGDDIDALVVVFGEDGRHKHTTSAFQTSSPDFAGGLEVYSPGIIGQRPQVLVVGGVRQASGIQRPYFSRFTLNADGTLSRNVGPKQLNTHWCDNTSRDCRPAGIALGRRGLSGTPVVYVVNRYYHQATPDESGWAMAVTRINENGDADSSWPSRWWYLSDLDTPLPRHNWVIDLAVRTTGLGVPVNPYRDNLFVLAEIKRRCGNGAYVMRLSHENDALAWPIFGGSSAPSPMCGLQGQPIDYPRAMAISGNRLAVVGFGSTQPLAIPGQPVPERVTDSWVAMLDISGAGGASLVDLRDFHYPNVGPRTHHSGLLGITPVADGRFVVTGDGRYPANAPANVAGKQFMITAGIAPDRIFGNGFQP